MRRERRLCLAKSNVSPPAYGAAMGKHARQPRRFGQPYRARPFLVTSLLLVLAVLLFTFKRTDGAAPGPAVVIAVMFSSSALRRRARAAQTALYVLTCGLSGVSLLGLSVSLGRALDTGQPAWWSTTAMWALAASASGAFLIQLRDKRERQRDQQLIGDLLYALDQQRISAGY